MQATPCLICGGFSDSHAEGCVQVELDNLRSLNYELASLLSQAINPDTQAYEVTKRSLEALESPDVKKQLARQECLAEVADLLEEGAWKASQGKAPEAHDTFWVRAELALDRLLRLNQRY